MCLFAASSGEFVRHVGTCKQLAVPPREQRPVGGCFFSPSLFVSVFADCVPPCVNSSGARTQGVSSPFDVEECSSGLLVANGGGNCVLLLPREVGGMRVGIDDDDDDDDDVVACSCIAASLHRCVTMWLRGCKIALRGCVVAHGAGVVPQWLMSHHHHNTPPHHLPPLLPCGRVQAGPSQSTQPTLGCFGAADGLFSVPTALALAPGTGLVVREFGNQGRFQVFAVGDGADDVREAAEPVAQGPARTQRSRPRALFCALLVLFLLPACLDPPPPILPSTTIA